MVTREMLEERNVELQVELAKYEDACQLVRGALWENQNTLTAMNELEEEDGNGISHNEVVTQPDDYCHKVPEPCAEAPYDDDDNGVSHDEVVPQPEVPVGPFDHFYDDMPKAPYEEYETWHEVIPHVAPVEEVEDE